MKNKKHQKNQDKHDAKDIKAKIDSQVGHNTNGTLTREDPDLTLEGRGNVGSANDTQIAKNKNQL